MLCQLPELVIGSSKWKIVYVPLLVENQRIHLKKTERKTVGVKNKQTHKTRERRKFFHAREIISVNVFSECHDKKK